MKELFKKFIKEEDGATMVEYAIMVAVIAMVVVIGALAVGNSTDAKFDSVKSCLDDTTNCPTDGA